MYSSGHVDWLAVTYPANLPPQYMLPTSVAQYPFVPEGRAALGYRYRTVNEFGAALLSGGNERQGSHLILSGQTLTNLREMGVTDHELCHHVTGSDGRLTRLDLAINIHDGTLTPQEVASSFDVGALKTPARSGLFIRGVHRDDRTFLLGSRTSDRYLRCYDKAAELRLPDTRWVRIELELKRRRANGCAHVIAAEDCTRQVINRMIGGFIQMPDNDELSAALREQTGEIPQEGRRLHDTYRWLMDQVAPAMGRYMAEHPMEDVITAFRTRVEIERRKYVDIAARRREVS